MKESLNLNEVAYSISTDKNFKPTIVMSSSDSPLLKRDKSGTRPFPKYRPMNERSNTKNE